MQPGLLHQLSNYGPRETPVILRGWVVSEHEGDLKVKRASGLQHARHFSHGGGGVR